MIILGMQLISVVIGYGESLNFNFERMQRFLFFFFFLWCREFSEILPGQWCRHFSSFLVVVGKQKLLIKTYRYTHTFIHTYTYIHVESHTYL